MPRARLPYLHKETARGKTFWYYRPGHGPRARLRGHYGSREFLAAYREADAGKPASGLNRSGEGTFGWLWTLYRASPAWERLSPATKKQRDNLMRLPLERAANQPLELFDRKLIIASCDARASTPAQARNFLGVLRVLFQWALSREHVEVDPTVGVKVERLRGDGFHAWTAGELAAFEERWPIGTRERLAYDLMLWTGLRRGDAALVGPSHVKDGIITLKTEKTGAPVTISDSASARALDRRGSLRAGNLCRSPGRFADGQGGIWELVRRGVPRSRRSGLGARATEGARNQARRGGLDAGGNGCAHGLVGGRYVVTLRTEGEP